MMQDSEVIKLVKPVPSDRLATQVLVMWYNTVRPKWKKPLDLAITAFFVLMTLYSFSLRPLPIFAWLSLAGVEREIREELVIDGSCTQRVLGVINDDSNDVGAVHLGIVHLFELDTDRVRANEAALANLRFVAPEELSGEMFEKLETWSQLALELFKNRGA